MLFTNPGKKEKARPQFAARRGRSTHITQFDNMAQVAQCKDAAQTNCLARCRVESSIAASLAGRKDMKAPRNVGNVPEDGSVTLGSLSGVP